MLKKGHVQYQPVDINESVQDVLRLMRSDLINHHITVDTDLAPALPRVRADRVGIQQVLLNLLTNGYQAMASSEPGMLVIRTRPGEPGMLMVCVVDQGPGIPAEALARIFEPFYTTKQQGMGIGLAVCRTIINAHGGRLWALNNPDRGATVSFSLPVEEGAA
jgi:signal transduction histidine kinase